MINIKTSFYYERIYAKEYQFYADYVKFFTLQ